MSVLYSRSLSLVPHTKQTSKRFFSVYEFSLLRLFCAAILLLSPSHYVRICLNKLGTKKSVIFQPFDFGDDIVIEVSLLLPPLEPDIMYFSLRLL